MLRVLNLEHFHVITHVVLQKFCYSQTLKYLIPSCDLDVYKVF